MVIDGVWRNKVRDMDAMKNHEGAKRELRKAKMSNGYKEASNKNKIFVDYCLALYAYNENDFMLANMYLKYIKDIFDENYKNVEDMAKEYSNYLWLKVDMNHKNMSMVEIVRDMTKVYEYYWSMNEKELAMGALINAFSFEGKTEDILECLDELLKCEKISDWCLIDRILETCDSISHELYIKALKLVNEYRVYIDVV